MTKLQPLYEELHISTLGVWSNGHSNVPDSTCESAFVYITLNRSFMVDFDL